MGLSNIQWTDYTFNPWIGCRKVAPECLNCYAETLDRNRFSKTMPGCSKDHPISHWGSGPRYRTSASNWREPLKWNNGPSICTECGAKVSGDRCGRGQCRGATRRPRVFCASLSDWLDDENVPIEWIADLLKLIHDTPNLDWLLLTKRPQNWKKRIEGVIGLSCVTGCEQSDPYGMAGWLANRWLHSNAPENIWLGVSAGADQAAALAIPAKIHFLSCEPMLHPLDETHAKGFNWIIFGGESGSKARMCHTEWFRDGIEFCQANGIAPFLKQFGSNCYAAGKDQKHLIAMEDSHGGDMTEWPEDLRVREFPEFKRISQP